MGGFAVPSRAQYVPSYFPTGVPGYNQELGVTVVSRLRPLYEAPGIRVGSFIIRPELDESLGYNTNVFGASPARGSPLVETHPSISINSDWGRNAIGASFSADDVRYLNTPTLNQTSWTAALGGSYTIGRSNLTLAYAHLNLFENPTDIGAPPSSKPIPFAVDDFRSSYTFDLGRLKITPNVELSLWRYGSTTIVGLPSNQSYRDANVLQGGTTLRYELSDQRSLLLVLQGIDSAFINPQPAGAPSLSSVSGLALAGIDYQYNGLWRYQLLAGFELRSFAASQFQSRAAPIARAAVIWTPTGLTTVTGTLIRTIDEPIQAGTSGFTYTSTELRVDHEYRRDVLLNGEVMVQNIGYLQNGGAQTSFSLSTGVTWLMNRHMSLTGQYTFTQQTSPGSLIPVDAAGVNTMVGGAFAQHLFLLTIHFGL